MTGDRQVIEEGGAHLKRNRGGAPTIIPKKKVYKGGKGERKTFERPHYVPRVISESSASNRVQGPI